MSAGAWWLREQVGAKGADLLAWPEATRAAALTLPRADLDAAGLTWGAAGGNPPPYLDPGHLLNSPDPDGVPAAPTRSTPTRSERPKASTAAAGDRARPWERRTRDWADEIALRAAIENATARAIVDGEGRPTPCCEDGWVFQHREHADRFRFRVSTCHVRGRCPHCGRAYGLDQASELHSLLSAALERRVRPLRDHDAAAWAFVVTLPRPVTELLGRLGDDPRERKALRREIAKVVKVARGYVEHMLKLDGLEDARQLGAAMNVHWWASENPMRGWHWHVHALVPNVRRDGRELRRRALFSEKALEGGRERLRELITRAWPTAAGGRWTPNAHVRYYLADAEGRRKLRHRTRYDARHPYADALKLARRRPAAVFAIDSERALETLANRVEDMQSIKLRRYVGWLVPGRRKDVGLVKPTPDEDEPRDVWIAVQDGYRRIVRWTDGGLIVRKYDRDGETHAEVADELIDFQSQAPPVRWEYNLERDRGRPVAEPHVEG